MVARNNITNLIIIYETLKNLCYLPMPIFSHSQLYVAVSRVTPREGLKNLITNEDGEDIDVTSNFVYEGVFRNVSCNVSVTH